MPSVSSSSLIFRFGLFCLHARLLPWTAYSLASDGVLVSDTAGRIVELVILDRSEPKANERRGSSISQCEARNIEIDAFGGFLCWIPDAAARLKRRSPIEDDEWNVSLDGMRPDLIHVEIRHTGI